MGRCTEAMVEVQVEVEMEKGAIPTWFGLPGPGAFQPSLIHPGSSPAPREPGHPIPSHPIHGAINRGRPAVLSFPSSLRAHPCYYC